jgi:hypothetical protein
VIFSSAPPGSLVINVSLPQNLEWPLSGGQFGTVTDCSWPEVASLATKGILDRPRPKLLAVLKIFTEQNLTAGILGRCTIKRFVDG